MRFDNAPTVTLSRDDYDTFGRILMETLSLSGLCMDMKAGRESDPSLLTPWVRVDDESQVVYRTAARELMTLFCQMVKINIAEMSDIDTPPWRRYFDLMRRQPMSSEPNVIFSALTCGKLPEA